ncbi:hypothetical protein NDU88_007148 [Pleurodeles waltl]|uniref:MKRN2 opposite strand protein-like C-terminal domain-containing protein n=1 Tax=Pleurodeles waltl TaxID=8319 RepID=A0AAV7NAQ3_PLEWA|nr:hypothetical protein NDU88_007148 [Pleurodeles waltl]
MACSLWFRSRKGQKQGVCPVCGQSAVASQRLEDAPVRIPSPFVNGHREKFSFLLKPTEGTFLRGYDGMSDLHVGITNSKGIVYNYNQAGVQREEWGWEQCVGVPLLQPDEYGLINLWDKYLEDFSTAETWLPHRYEEYQHNCYTYALAFVNCMLAAQGKRQKLSKNEFTEQFNVNIRHEYWETRCVEKVSGVTCTTKEYLVDRDKGLHGEPWPLIG